MRNKNSSGIRGKMKKGTSKQNLLMELAEDMFNFAKETKIMKKIKRKKK